MQGSVSELNEKIMFVFIWYSYLHPFIPRLRLDGGKPFGAYGLLIVAGRGLLL